MTTRKSPFRLCLSGRPGSGVSPRSRNERGMALLTTLLLLILVSILGLAMAITSNSDMLINSYYGSYRGSFYAADSGLNIARAAMVSEITGQVSTTACAAWGSGAASGCTSAPLNGTTAASTAQSYLTSTYNSFTSLNAGQATSSWPEKFMVPSSISSCTTGVTFPTTSNPQITATNSSGQPTQYQYTFNYTICSVGRAQAPQQVATKENGSVIVTVTAQAAGTTPTPYSFAAFGGFINNFSTCQGPLASGTMTGPFFTNGSWNFGTGGTYIFTDPVGQASPTADFIFSSGWGSGAPSCNGVSGCDCKNASSDSYSGQTIAPTFQSGFNLNQPAVALPANDFTEQWAVIDGVGCGEAGTTCGVSAPPYPTNAQLNTYLKNISGTDYPSAGASSGVYIAYCTTDCATQYPTNTPAANTVLGGGFYVEGDASIQTSLGTDGSGNPTQTYTITQTSTGGCGGRHSGSCGSRSNTTTTITVDINANTTTVSQSPTGGTSTLVLAGVPENKAPGVTPEEGAMIYVDGTVTGLSGPGQGTASLQDYYATTIAANGNIDVNGDLIYNHEPVTLNSSDTLIAGNDYNQVLGLFTANGDIVWSSSYSNHNVEIDASMAALNSSCTSSSSQSICGFATSGTVGTVTIVGGRIESNAHSVSLNAVNTYFDRRFTSRQGFAPPWFPSTTIPENDITSAPSPPLVVPSTQRLTWVTWPQ